MCLQPEFEIITGDNYTGLLGCILLDFYEIFPMLKALDCPQTMVTLPCYPTEVTMVWGPVHGIQHGIT